MPVIFRPLPRPRPPHRPWWRLWRPRGRRPDPVRRATHRARRGRRGDRRLQPRHPAVRDRQRAAEADSPGVLPPGRHRRVTASGVAFHPSNSPGPPSAEADAGCFENLRDDRPESVALAWAPRRPFSRSPECSLRDAANPPAPTGIAFNRDAARTPFRVVSGARFGVAPLCDYPRGGPARGCGAVQHRRIVLSPTGGASMPATDIQKPRAWRRRRRNLTDRVLGRQPKSDPQPC